MHPILLVFSPLCSGCKYITHFHTTAFYTHVAQMQIISGRWKAARIRPTLHGESVARQELMKSRF